MSRQEPESVALDRPRQQWVKADPGSEAASQGCEERVVEAADVEHPCVVTDPWARASDPPLLEDPVGALHRVAVRRATTRTPPDRNPKAGRTRANAVQTPRNGRP